MSRFRKFVLISVVAVLGMVGLQSSAHSATTKVKLILRVTNCAGCTVQLVQGLDIGTWSSRLKTVPDSDERMVFYVPRWRTRGLTIEVNDPKAVDTGAMHVAALRFSGFDPGELVTKTQAAQATKAYACSAKIRTDIKRWHLVVDKFASTSRTGVAGYDIRPYLNPGVRVMDAGQRTPLAHQDAWYCLTPYIAY